MKKKFATGYRATDGEVLFKITHGMTLRDFCQRIEDLVRNGDITAGDMECSIVDQGQLIYVEKDAQGIMLRADSAYYDEE